MQVLELWKNILGYHHPDVASSLNNLALLYYSQGRYIEAESLYVEAIELRKYLLGDEHPDVAFSLNNLANLYNSQGRYFEAESLYVQALDIFEKRLGETHPNTVTVHKSLEMLRTNFNNSEDILDQKKNDEISQGLPGKLYSSSETSLPCYLPSKEVSQQLLVQYSTQASQSKNRRKLLKQGLIGLIATYGIAVASNPSTSHFLQLINLPLTGVGSLLLATFGIFMSYLGAILLPIITSAGTTIYFFSTQRRYASALSLSWVALCLFDISSIINFDTKNIFIIGKCEHPGYYILSTLGWLQQDNIIGNFLYILAFLIFWVSIFAGLYYANE